MSSPQINHIKNDIRAAFKPFNCRVTVSPYGENVKFRVFSTQGKPIGPLTKAMVSNLREQSFLRAIIISARERLQQDGYQLESWSQEVRGLVLHNRAEA